MGGKSVGDFYTIEGVSITPDDNSLNFLRFDYRPKLCMIY